MSLSYFVWILAHLLALDVIVDSLANNNDDDDGYKNGGYDTF